uniref:Uncharacterized protein n=1 Tax=Rhodosorus marinus TaxID=101924 RepID=A0A7S2ZGZ9_9RHOD|mmetsp:Transcript_17886/g.71752  ORF Transcript_17886/g.71752 Transcript_17886/m.71752 type:complete len:132 (+) Transcript_17886:401-796(+)
MNFETRGWPIVLPGRSYWAVYQLEGNTANLHEELFDEVDEEQPQRRDCQRKNIQLSQIKHTLQVLKRFAMDQSKPVRTPRVHESRENNTTAPAVMLKEAPLARIRGLPIVQHNEHPIRRNLRRQRVINTSA